MGGVGGPGPSPARPGEGTVSRWNHASAWGANTLLFRGILTSPTCGGKGLGEREEAAGEGAAQPVALWPPNRWLGPGSLNTRCRGQSCAPAAKLRSLSPGILHPKTPHPYTLIYIYFLFFYFDIEIRPLLQKRLVSLVCGPVLLVPEIRPSIAIAGGEGCSGIPKPVSTREDEFVPFCSLKTEFCVYFHTRVFSTRDRFVPGSPHTLKHPLNSLLMMVTHERSWGCMGTFTHGFCCTHSQPVYKHSREKPRETSESAGPLPAHSLDTHVASVLVENLLERLQGLNAAG